MRLSPVVVDAMTDDFSELGTYQEKRPPIVILVLAAAAVTGTFVLLRWADFTSHLIGYGLGSVVCAGLAAVFMRIDTARRTAEDVVYIEFWAARYVWSAVLLAGLAGCSIHAWYIADQLAVNP
jgi:hypothetical protein